MIRFEHVNKSYGAQKILNNLNFEIASNEFTVLIGPSGCGKTTTLKMINRLIEPDDGIISIDGERIDRMDKVKLRRSIGYVIQQIGLFPNMTVEENINVVPKLLKYDQEEMEQIARSMLELVHMPYESYAHKYPSQLSGGQQQRIGVLRALAASPPIVLMDEPFGALDPMTRRVLQDEVRRLQQKLNKTIVFVTHDMDEALNLADTIIFMERGKIVQMASPDEMLQNPSSDLISEFMSQQLSELNSTPETAAEVMRSHVTSVYPDRGLRSAVDLMARRDIDSLIIKSRGDERFVGTVSIRAIKQALRQDSGARTVEDLLYLGNSFCYVDDEAQLGFDRLLDSDDNFLIVLNRDETVAGIITKTTVAKALADAVWGEI